MSLASIHRTEHFDQKLSYRRLLNILLSRWHWIVSTIVIAVSIAYLLLSFTPNSFTTDATLKFEDKRSEISELVNVRNVYDRSNKLQSEQFVIRSRNVLLNAAKSLNYDISYMQVGYFNNQELYPAIPFKIQVLQMDTASDVSRQYSISPIRKDQFILKYQDATGTVNRTYLINEPVVAGKFKFIVLEIFSANQLNKCYLINFNRPEDLLRRIDAGLTIIENKNTNILTFKQIDRNPIFAADILNAILKEYVKFDQAQKTQSATQTITFIDTLQGRLSNVVSHSGSVFEKFKIKSKMLTVAGSTNQAVVKLEALHKQKADLHLQALRIKQLDKEVSGKQSGSMLSFSAEDANDPFLSNLLIQYSGLLLKKQSLLITYKTGSETLREIDSQLQSLQQTLVNNLHAVKQKNQQAQAFIDQQIIQHTKAIKSIPTAEKNYVSLQSTFDVNQKIYAYLNQKKLEALISRASITPAANIVNMAIYQPLPIAPVKINYYKTAVLIGLISGIGLIFLVRILNPYIFDQETLEHLSETTVIGIIKKFPRSSLPFDFTLLERYPKSLFAESVRLIRTNISFLAPDITNKVICITSETSGEGKSFTAINLAQTLTMLDKKVIVIAADLRKSKLHHAFSTKNDVGLSSYLSGQMPLKDIIISKTAKLDFITGGPVPPNPAELLYGDKMTSLITTLKKEYDYTIIDSAPVGLVSDAIPLLKIADINLFIIRAGFSRYHAASVPEKLSTIHRLTNFNIILNAYNHDTLHSPYYNYYNSISPYYADINYNTRGYFEGESKKRWWSFKRYSA
jgi:tyrosine-protein kinase Etk/Wzc